MAENVVVEESSRDACTAALERLSEEGVEVEGQGLLDAAVAAAHLSFPEEGMPLISAALSEDNISGAPFSCQAQQTTMTRTFFERCKRKTGR